MSASHARRLAAPLSQADFERSLKEHLDGIREDGVDRVPGADGVRAGFALHVLDDIRERLGLNAEAIERALQVSTRTLQRRREQGERLTPAESDRLWRLLSVMRLAERAFGDEAAAKAWLTSPKTLLGGETPLMRLDTEPGLREVEDMLTVIDETAPA